MSKSNSKQLEIFVDKLMEEKDFGGLDPEVVAQIKSDLLDRVEDRVNAAILANLSPEKLEYFEKLLEQSEAEEIQAFCRRNIYDLDQIIANELADFRGTYLSA